MFILCLSGTKVFMVHVYGICIWLVKLLLTFSIALDNAWKSIVQCHSHKKCPVSVNYYFCLLHLPLSRSMLKCLSVIVDLSVFNCISHSTCFIHFEGIVRCIDLWFIGECSFISFWKLPLSHAFHIEFYFVCY